MIFFFSLRGELHWDSSDDYTASVDDFLKDGHFHNRNPIILSLHEHRRTVRLLRCLQFLLLPWSVHCAHLLLLWLDFVHALLLLLVVVEAVVNVLFPWFLSCCLPSVYIKTTDFCVLILPSHILLKGSISCRHFLVPSLGSFTYRTRSSTIKILQPFIRLLQVRLGTVRHDWRELRLSFCLQHGPLGLRVCPCLWCSRFVLSCPTELLFFKKQF